MENYHEGISEGEILETAALWTAAEFLCLG